MEAKEKQLKSPKALTSMMKKYGPGFVALSLKSGRVVASGKTIKEVWEKVQRSILFKSKQIVIRHVPPVKKTQTSLWL